VERLKGIGVSAGLAVGPALVAIQRTQVIRFPIAHDRVARELSALERARVRSHEQISQIRRRIAELKGADLAAIFDAQLLLLDDPMVVGRAASIVMDERVNAEWAVQRAVDELATVFNDVEDPYLRERKGDLHDVAGRLRMNMRGEMGGVRDLLHDLEQPCVLVGGLGMGFTLRATLDLLPRDATVVVAELVPAVVEWNRGPLGPLAGHPLKDKRVHVDAGDVAGTLSLSRGRFDVVLLDVDNGPAAFTTAGNARLYDDRGLAAARAALKTGGVLAVWSAREDRKFEQRLRYRGFAVEVERVRGRLKKGGPRHTIFLGRKEERR